jgi:hypothetical protein
MLEQRFFRERSREYVGACLELSGVERSDYGCLVTLLVHG